MTELVKQILSYTEYLINTTGWHITIHNFGMIPSAYTEKFLPYRVHKNPFCVHLKNNSEVWKRCMERQYSTMESISSPIHFGMCHCGVEEFVLTISHQKRTLGFISISGYRNNTEKALSKLSHIAEKYCLNLEELKKSYFDNLSSDVPDIKLVYTLTAPLIRMLELLYLYQTQLHAGLAQKPEDYASIFTQLLLHLEHSYREHITLDDLCQRFHCSKSYLSHMFKNQTGENINQYINRLRIEESKTLLHDTPLSISNIAFMVGFSSSNYFSSIFHRYCGVSPCEYRNLK